MKQDVCSTGYAISVPDGVTVNLTGTVTSPCWLARYNTSQEGSASVWNNRGHLGPLIFSGSNPSNPAQIVARFTKGTTLGNNPSYIHDNYAYGVANIAHCEFYGGGIFSAWSAGYYTNTLFFRCNPGITSWQGGSSCAFQNCLYWNSGLYLNRSSGNAHYATWLIQDTAFDGSNYYISISDGLSGNPAYTFFDHNAYLQGGNQTVPAGQHDLSVTNYYWQAGPLGSFYQLTNSPLINADTNTTADQVGLYHFTGQ